MIQGLGSIPHGLQENSCKNEIQGGHIPPSPKPKLVSLVVRPQVFSKELL